MYDPMTVAHEIKSPFRGRKSKLWPKGYRNPLVTIWHVDPETPGRGNRTDDSCGWFRPPMTPEEAAKFRKIGESEWSHLFAKRAQLARGDPEKYAYVCYEPTTYDAVYWMWRRIKRERTKHVWMYGRERGSYLTAGELQYIYSLAANPMDNLQSTVAGVKNEEDCADLFMLVYRAFSRYNRPWYRHPRWHVHHWHFQVHPWQTFRRWALSRCAKCGGRFAWGYSPTSLQWDNVRPGFLQGETGVYHSECCGVGESANPQSTPSGPVCLPLDLSRPRRRAQ